LLPLKTALALANTNSQAATVSFFFTDDDGGSVWAIECHDPRQIRRWLRSSTRRHVHSESILDEADQCSSDVHVHSEPSDIGDGGANRIQ